MRTWKYYEIRNTDGSPRLQSLDKKEVEFYVSWLIKHDVERPEIHEIERTGV